MFDELLLLQIHRVVNRVETTSLARCNTWRHTYNQTEKTAQGRFKALNAGAPLRRSTEVVLMTNVNLLNFTAPRWFLPTLTLRVTLTIAGAKSFLPPYDKGIPSQGTEGALRIRKQEGGTCDVGGQDNQEARRIGRGI